MAKNKLNDLTDHLFMMIENLNDDELCQDSEKLNDMVNRAKVIADLSDKVIQVQQVQLHALEVADKCGYCVQDMPSSLSLTYAGKK